MTAQNRTAPIRTAETRLFATGGILLATLLAVGLFATGDSRAENVAGAADREVAASGDFRAQLIDLLEKEPEIVIAAIERFQLRQQEERQRQIAEALPQFIPQIEKLVTEGERVLVQGDEKGDLTLIEFADYNCGVCRRVQPEIQAFLKADPKIRHVVKALAYIGSPYPELAIVAAAEQGDDAKVAAFHRAMMSSDGQLSNQKVLELAGEVGLDAKKIAADVESPSVQERVQRTIGIARALEIEGTPALIFPDRITSFVTADDMAAIAEEIRAAR